MEFHKSSDRLTATSIDGSNLGQLVKLLEYAIAINTQLG